MNCLIKDLFDEEKFSKQISGIVENIKGVFEETEDSACLGSELADLHKVSVLLLKKDEKEFMEDHFRKANIHIYIFKCLEFPIKPEFGKIVFKAICCLSNISMLSKEYAEILIKNKIISKISVFIESNLVQMISSIYFLLANLLTHGFELGPLLLQNNLIQFILENDDQIFASKKLSAQIPWFISNLFKSNCSLDQNIKRQLLVKTRQMWREYQSPEIIHEMTWMLKHFLENNEGEIAFFDQQNYYQILSNILKAKEMNNILAVLKIYAKLSMGDESILKKFIDEDFKWQLFELMEIAYNQEEIIALTTWIISNACLTSKSLCLMFYDQFIMDFLISKFSNPQTPVRLVYEGLHVLQSIWKMIPNSYKKKIVLISGILEPLLSVFRCLELKVVTMGLFLVKEFLFFAQSFSKSE